jgi:hypothetical protein
MTWSQCVGTTPILNSRCLGSSGRSGFCGVRDVLSTEEMCFTCSLVALVAMCLGHGQEEIGVLLECYGAAASQVRDVWWVCSHTVLQPRYLQGVFGLGRETTKLLLLWDWLPEGLPPSFVAVGCGWTGVDRKGGVRRTVDAIACIYAGQVRVDMFFV